LNWLDITLIVIAAIIVVSGFKQGFSRVAVGLAALVAGIFLACWFYGVAGAFLLPFVSKPALAHIAGFIIVFVVVQIVGALLSWLLAKLFKWTGLTWLDRLLGGLFGVLQAGLVGIVLVMILMAFPIMPVPRSVADSKIAPYLAGAANVLVNVAPRELKDGFWATYSRLLQIWSGQGDQPAAKETV